LSDWKLQKVVIKPLFTEENEGKVFC